MWAGEEKNGRLMACGQCQPTRLTLHKILCTLSHVEFEFDPNKSEANLAKHGIDFDSAQELWNDRHLMILPAQFPMEPRYLAIGSIGGKHWTAVFTERGEHTRIISVRRARDNERSIYERNKQ